MSGSFIVITGTPVSGFIHYGPFAWDEASEFAEGDATRDTEWWIVPLTNPTQEQPS